MRKYLAAALALAIMATAFAGCGKRNVSDNGNGLITEPTAMTNPATTMPSTDTIPSVATETTSPTDHSVTTEPEHGNGSTNATDITGETGAVTGEGRARSADPRFSGRA